MTQTSTPTFGKITMFMLALLFITFVGIGVATETGMIDNILAKRGVGIILGLMMITTGNVLPKLVHPPECSPQIRAVERFTGWVFVLTGFALLIALSPVPDTLVAFVTPIIGLTGFGLVSIATIWSNLSVKGNKAVDEADMSSFRHNAKARLGAIFILHGIGWAFAIFLADMIWGDASAKWMIIAFSIANCLLVIPFMTTLSASKR